MSYSILALVLVAAVLDAVQHCLIKSGTDPFARSLAVALAGGLIAAPLVLVVGLPDAAALPWLAGSVVVGTLYWIALGWAYQSGALAVVFPLSRGCGVVLTVLGSHLLVGERLSLGQTTVLCAILAGLALVTFGSRPKDRLTRTALIPSLCLGVIIGSFTLVDVMGVRVAGSALQYCLILYLGNAVGVGLFAAIRHGPRLARIRPAAVPGIVSSACLSIAAYAMILFGFAHAPVALVAAVAESSIAFAALLGFVLLREPVRVSQSIGVLVIAAGVMLLRLKT